MIDRLIAKLAENNKWKSKVNYKPDEETYFFTPEELRTFARVIAKEMTRIGLSIF